MNEQLFSMMKTPASDNLVQALARGLTILETVARSPQPVGLQEVAATAGLKVPTAHNLLRTLLVKGYIRRTSKPVRYTLGPAAQGLAARVGEEVLYDTISAEMLVLAERFSRATVTLSEPCEGEIVKMLRCAPGTRDVRRPRGGVLPFYTSASGLAFQAFAETERAEEYRRLHPFWEEAPAVWQEPATLSAFLDAAAAAGCVAVCFSGDYLRKLAAPIYIDGTLWGMLGVSIPDDADGEAEEDHVRTELTASARKLTGSLSQANSNMRKVHENDNDK